MTPVEKLLATVRAEIGYLEKESYSQLDSKTANAGDKNYTKFARDLDTLNFYNGKKNGYAWCDIFRDWCFVQTFGLELALKMTGQKLGGYGAVLQIRTSSGRTDFFHAEQRAIFLPHRACGKSGKRQSIHH